MPLKWPFQPGFTEPPGMVITARYSRLDDSYCGGPYIGGGWNGGTYYGGPWIDLRCYDGVY